MMSSGLDTFTLANALIIGKQPEYALAESTSASIATVTHEPEGAAYVDDEDLPVEVVSGGVRPRHSVLNTRETGAPSTLSGHSNNDETSDMDYNGPDYNGNNAEDDARSMTSKKQHLCPICTDRSFSKPSHLVRHMRTHTKEKPFTCPVCSKTFSQSYSMTSHALRTHRQYVCSVCGESLGGWAEMRTHKMTHAAKELSSRPVNNNNKPPLLCGICGKAFTYEYALKNHVRRHGEPFYCSECDKHFSGLSRYDKHREFHARKEKRQTRTGERPHQCSCCAESFTRREDLELHRLTHRKLRGSHPCTRCDGAFSSLGELTAHMRLHEGEQPMSCPECGRRFLNKAKLERHVAVHAAATPHLCSVCGSRFLKPGPLKAHMRTHTGEKPYRCSHCSKSFKTAYGLKHHGWRHAEAAAAGYTCPDCGKTYGRQTVLRQHRRSHTGEKPYACPCCDKRFLTRDKRGVHVRTHTGERPYRCGRCGKTFTQVGDRNRHGRRCAVNGTDGAGDLVSTAAQRVERSSGDRKAPGSSPGSAYTGQRVEVSLGRDT